MSCLAEGIECVKLALVSDRVGDISSALRNYEAAIDYFSGSINNQEVGSPETRIQLQEEVQVYVDRIAELKQIISKDTPKLQNVPSDEQALIDRISSTVLIEKPKCGFDSVCGLHHEKRMLEQAVIFPIKFPDLYMSGLKAYKSFLLFGPPGTGKSHLARALAGATEGTTYFTVSATDLISKWQGESEALVKNLFRVARLRKPSIIFVDEIDAIGRTRADADSDSSRRVKTELFIQLEGANSDNSGVFFMAATNCPESLDSALLRRFDKLIYVSLPDAETRVSIFQSHFGTGKILSEEDVNQLEKLTKGLSGSEITVLCNEAKMQSLCRLQKCEFFKPTVLLSGRTLFAPCASTRRGALKMTLAEVPTGCLNFIPSATRDDIFSCARKAKPKTDAACLRKLEKFAEDKAEKFSQMSPKIKHKRRSFGRKVSDFCINLIAL